MLSIFINTRQQAVVTLKPNHNGKNLVLLERPVWSLLSGDANLDEAPDGMSATLSASVPGQMFFLVAHPSEVIQLTVSGEHEAALGTEVRVEETPVPAEETPPPTPPAENPSPS